MTRDQSRLHRLSALVEQFGQKRLRLVFCILFGVAGSLVVPDAAGAMTSGLFLQGTGYDVSYPNCSAATYPSGFAIVGVGGGRPFTTNSCWASEWTTASGGSSVPSIYFNTGLATAYAKQITSACATMASQSPTVWSGSAHAMATERQAWEIGCSEADYAASLMRAVGAAPTSWWADVEAGNSWSTNTTLNLYAIDGIVYRLARALNTVSVPGGIYSNQASWNKIAGGPGVNTTPTMTAEWVAGPTTCPSGGFSQGAPVWLIQSGTTTVGSNVFDVDQAC